MNYNSKVLAMYGLNLGRNIFEKNISPKQFYYNQQIHNKMLNAIFN